MSEHETNLVIEELLKTIARLKMENASKDFENEQLKEDVASFRKVVARLEEEIAKKEVSQAS